MINRIETEPAKETVWKRYVASAVLADLNHNGEKYIVHSLITVEAKTDAGAIAAALDDAKKHHPKANLVSVKAVLAEPPDLSAA